MVLHIRKLIVLLIVFSTIALFGCGGGGGSASSNTSSTAKTTSLTVTDAPALDYAHVYVTVNQLAFHTDNNVGFTNYSTSAASGWQIFRLPTPVTIDLATLVNGKMYADPTTSSSLFNGLTLSSGRYQQIRIFLAASEDPYVGSVPGLTYNNEVQLPGDSAQYILRVPTPTEGIKVIPEFPVVVDGASDVKLALDFNLADDIVQTSPNGTTEYILKPRLGFFDMNSVGAVTGTVSFGNLSTSRFIIKAEQLKAGTNYRITRRLTSVDKTTGVFNLYPLPVFGNNTTASYDILLRGLKAQTAIIKNVRVHKGESASSGAVNLGTIKMQPGTDFTVQIKSQMHPSGSWINFYQAIAGDTNLYEVRYDHLDPYMSVLPKPFALSSAAIQVATYDNVAGTVGTFAADTSSQGRFTVIADANRYNRGGQTTISVTPDATSLVNFNPNAPFATVPNSITANITMPSRFDGALTTGHLFVTEGGLILDSYNINGVMTTNGGSFKVDGLPGGTPTSPLTGSYYGVTVLGWGGNKLGSATVSHLDLTTGNAGPTMNLR